MLDSMKNGVTASFAGITTTNSYNKRLQPVFLSAASPTQTIFSLGYDFGLSTADNGNVSQITNNLDATRSQSFTYDSRNLLASAQNGGSPKNSFDRKDGPAPKVTNYRAGEIARAAAAVGFYGAPLQKQELRAGLRQIGNLLVGRCIKPRLKSGRHE